MCVVVVVEGHNGRKGRQFFSVKSEVERIFSKYLAIIKILPSIQIILAIIKLSEYFGDDFMQHCVQPAFKHSNPILNRARILCPHP